MVGGAGIFDEVPEDPAPAIGSWSKEQIDSALRDAGIEACSCEEAEALRALLGERGGQLPDSRQMPFNLDLAQRDLGQEFKPSALPGSSVGTGDCADEAEQEEAGEGAADPGVEGLSDVGHGDNLERHGEVEGVGEADREARRQANQAADHAAQQETLKGDRPSLNVQVTGERLDHAPVVVHGANVFHADRVPNNAPASDMAVSVRTWGYGCASCGTAFKGELSDPCPDCGHFGKRTIWESDVVAECDDCGGAYFGRSACPRCARARNQKLAHAIVARFDLEWERFFESLPGFEGWSQAREQAKAIAQEQRIAVLALDARGGI